MNINAATTINSPTTIINNPVTSIAEKPELLVDINIQPYKSVYYFVPGAGRAGWLHDGGGVPAIYKDGDDNIWEVAPSGDYYGTPTIEFSVVYNAPSDSPTVIINEIGIKVEMVQLPKTGSFLWYTPFTGATGDITYMRGSISSNTGKNPLTYQGYNPNTPAKFNWG